MQQRINKLREFLKDNGLDTIIVSNFFNILYLSGFKTLTENEREAWMLISKNSAYLFTDSRYINNQSTIKKNEFLELKEISPEKNLINYLKEIFLTEKIKKCAVESDDLKLLEYNTLKIHLKEIEFVPAKKLIIKQREIKDKKEIEKIKKACEISDQCLKNIIPLIKIGTTEKEIAFKIEFWLKEKGYDLAFYPIVAVDENSAIPHYDTRTNGTKKINNGSIVLIDFGAKYQNYISDITRMIFVGQPDNKIVYTYNQLLDAQIKTVNRLKKEKKCKNIDQYCRRLLNNCSTLFIYPHSTGHGVGLEVHEHPKLSYVSEESLYPNQVLTVEPGIYIDGKWGMRIEDTVAIKNNNVEVLTKFSKDLLIV